MRVGWEYKVLQDELFILYSAGCALEALTEKYVTLEECTGYHRQRSKGQKTAAEVVQRRDCLIGPEVKYKGEENELVQMQIIKEIQQPALPL